MVVSPAACVCENAVERGGWLLPDSDLPPGHPKHAFRPGRFDHRADDFRSNSLNS